MPTANNNEQELIALRQTVAQLLAQNEAMSAERDRIKAQVQLLTVERDLLKERLRASMRKLFAAKSEARSVGQNDLFFNEAEALATPSTSVAEEAPSEPVQVPAHRRVKPGRKPLDAALPRELIRHELPEAERVCPHDGATLQAIGVEASEQLDIIPQQIRVIRHERVKYACPCCDQSIKLTPAPARIIPKGLLSDAALAWVISAKYLDGLPLYRQAALMGRFGGDLSRNTLAWSVVRVGQALTPMINLLRDRLLESTLILDDFAIAAVGAGERNDLLELLDDRVGTRATLITSQLPISAWHEWLADPTLADAILDRIVHGAHKIALKGESLRKAKSKKSESA